MEWLRCPTKIKTIRPRAACRFRHASAPPAQSLAGNVARLPSAERWEKLRVLEAVLFAATRADG